MQQLLLEIREQLWLYFITGGEDEDVGGLRVGGGGRHGQRHGEQGKQGHGLPYRTSYWVKPGHGLKD